MSVKAIVLNFTLLNVYFLLHQTINSFAILETVQSFVWILALYAQISIRNLRPPLPPPPLSPLIWGKPLGI